MVAQPSGHFPYLGFLIRQRQFDLEEEDILLCRERDGATILFDDELHAGGAIAMMAGVTLAGDEVPLHQLRGFDEVVGDFDDDVITFFPQGEVDDFLIGVLYLF